MDYCCQGNKDSSKKIEETAEVLKAIGDPKRLKILCTLLEQKICVCELAEHLDMQQNLISFHLRTLYEVGILEKSREGNNIYYTVKKEWEKKIESIFKSF